MSLEEQTKYSCILGKHYPLPIVDHKEAVRMAREKISKVRKDDNYGMEGVEQDDDSDDGCDDKVENDVPH